MRVEAKICGLGRPEDARRAADAGADYLGVVFAPGPRHREREEGRRIREGIDARRVGVFVDPEEAEVVEAARLLGLAVVQLHGSEDPSFCRRVAGSGDWAVWKAVRVGAETRLAAEAERYADAVDGVLLEGWSARGQGGVGARFDWAQAEKMRAHWPRGLRLILAGGLNAGNVEEAIRRVRPDVVDTSSGVETAPGVKDPQQMKDFLDAVKRARR